MAENAVVEEERVEPWNLVIFPRIAKAEDSTKVRQLLATILKVDPEKVEGWYRAEGPTLLLKQVDKAVAEKYMQTILRCGATCNIQRSSESGKHTPVPTSRSTDFFICPSCAYVEEIPKGALYAQCPKCEIVIAEWEARAKEERDKQAIRRRLRRKAGRNDDQFEDEKGKRVELALVRELERDIMRDLNMKPPGPLWRFYQRHPFLISFPIVVLLVGAASIATFQYDRRTAARQHARLLAERPSDQIQTIAPILADAVTLQQNGNRADLSNLASVTSGIRGDSGEVRQKIIQTAQAMMKGVNPSAFVEQAMQHHPLPSRSLPEANGGATVPVNTGTIGGVTGLKGVDHFDSATLDRIAPLSTNPGIDKVLYVLGQNREIADPKDSTRKVVTSALDQLDGSGLVNLLDTLQNDPEWDQFLLENVGVWLKADDTDRAMALAEAIHSPAMQIGALTQVVMRILKDQPDGDIEAPMTSIMQALDKIQNPDQAARILLTLGKRLADAGIKDEPARSIEHVTDMIRTTKSQVDKVALAARLAVAELHMGKINEANTRFNMAVNIARRIAAPEQRIAVFTQIAERYYDARNTSLANRILSDAQVLAATNLDTGDRSEAFARIAMAQAYVGDMTGALASIDNAGVGAGARQLRARLAAIQISRGDYYAAQATLDDIGDPLAWYRLEFRMISDLLHGGNNSLAQAWLDQSSGNIDRIPDAVSRSMILAEYARLYYRMGDQRSGQRFFKSAESLSKNLSGRERDIAISVIALNQAKAFLFVTAGDTVAEVKDPVIRDAIQAEMAKGQTDTKTVLPKASIPKVSDNG